MCNKHAGTPSEFLVCPINLRETAFHPISISTPGGVVDFFVEKKRFVDVDLFFQDDIERLAGYFGPSLTPKVYQTPPRTKIRIRFLGPAKGEVHKSSRKNNPQK